MALPGFPKKITTTKVHRGRYRIDREDGHSIEVINLGRCWQVYAGLTTAPRLSTFQYDMRNGFTAHDQTMAEIERMKH
ncbi:hypothetical protein [Tritonibacter mobilis]|uniref:hypothetical protein n=1 Tax=Tritonibacter mobilis TaxID=379347 RepID=UPI0008069045|nr:hypothetical protein [Tritonibacter mobilis]